MSKIDKLGEEQELALSNLRTYLDISTEALAESQRAAEEGRDGRIIRLDPRRVSFKQALIAITFAGIYLEALLYVVGSRTLGKEEYEKFDRRTYEAKLKRLGINDPSILDACRRFREARNDLVHEKATELGGVGTPMFRIAQDEAKEGVEFVQRIAKLLEMSA